MGDDCFRDSVFPDTRAMNPRPTWGRRGNPPDVWTAFFVQKQNGQQYDATGSPQYREQKAGDHANPAIKTG